MIVEVYTDGVLAYDSRLPEEAGYGIQSIQITESINKGGSATIILPPKHPLYDGFPAFRAEVEIYRDGKLRWRGRPLPPTDDTYRRRSILCEGELCFLQDAIHRPYLYQSDPASIFRAVIEVYNAAVEPWKRFAVGTVSVTDPNDYIRLEGNDPATVYDVVQKLIDRCGGFIFFDSAEDGTRCINWYAGMPYACNQTVRLGENLLTLDSQYTVTNFATRIIPYGAKQEDGTRLKLDIDGKDYVQNDDAVALRGVIEASEIYDDITLPENLLSRAMADLAVRTLLPNIIQLSAVDLSRQKLDLDAFSVGQRVPAESAPHSLSGLYDLTALTEDLVNPAVGSITLVRESASIAGGDGRTLTGALAIGNRKQSAALERAEQEIRADYQRNIAVTEQKLRSEIDQTAGEIRTEVSDAQAKINLQSGKVDQLEEKVSAVKQTADDVYIEVQDIRENGVGRVVTSMGYRFDDDGLHIAKPGNEIANQLDHTGMHVTRSGENVLQATADGVKAIDITVKNYLSIGKYARFEAYSDGTDSKRTGCFFVEGD